MRVLLLGGSGQLGSDIARLWKSDDISAPSSSALKIEHTRAVQQAIRSERAEIVINCTAFHHVDLCETESDRAFAVNALAVGHLAEACAESNAVFVTFSTDYVFEGNKGSAYDETDSPAPISAYGASKLAGELLVTRLRSQAFVVRVCGLYGTRISTSKGYTFIDRMIERARVGEPLRVVNDQTISPTYTAHVARALRDLVATKRYGLYHMVNEGAVTWHAFATEALRQAGIAHPIEPVVTPEFPAKARRPQYSALRNDRLHDLGISMPSWQDGVAAYLGDKAALSAT